MGLTEVCGAYSNAFLNICNSDCAGQLFGNVTAKIVDSHGNLCGIDGEICVKTLYTLLGYYRNPEANVKLFDSDGFLKTGDIGHFDKNGNLYIVDRKANMFEYNGHIVKPSEIEAVLLKSSNIDTVCVVGISDAVGTNLPAAAVVRKDGSEISEEEISAIVSGEYDLRF